MRETRDPVRLTELDEPAFEELLVPLREAREHGPDERQRSRMRATLGLPEAAPEVQDGEPGEGASDGGVSTGPLARPVTPWLKLFVSGILVFGAAFGGYRLLREASVETPPARAAAPMPARAAAHAERKPEHAAEPAAVLTEEPSEPHSRPEIHDTRPRPRRSPAQSGPAPADDPAGELALLQRARAHARSGPERALSLVAEHEARYPHGAFEQEREVIAVEAMIAAGRVEQARKRAARFFDRFAASAHARRIRALLSALSDTKETTSSHGTQ